MRRLFLLLLLISNLSLAKEPVRVGVLDTGLDLNDKRFTSHLCSTGHRDFTGEGIEDTHFHGTHVTGLIVKYAKQSNYCLIILKFYSKNQPEHVNFQNLIKAFVYIKENKIDIVNYSGGGKGSVEEEYLAVKTNNHTLFFVAAGNDNLNIDIVGYYPASYNLSHVRVVGSIDRLNKKSSFSNYGKVVKYWEQGESIFSTLPNNRWGFMSGTSMSTASATGKYLNENYR